MRYGVHKTSPRSLLSLTLVCLALFVTAGCGGGGGTASTNNGGGGGGGGGNAINLRGVVRDFTGSGVKNVLIEVVGTSLNTTTDSMGFFNFSNVPQTIARIRVTRPVATGYYNVAQYQAADYDLLSCSLPLPALSIGNNTLNSEITMYGALDPNSSPPPPPPLSGCP